MAERYFSQAFVVAGAILERHGRFLLVQERGTADPGKWNQPAGWVDVGEDPVAAVVREVKEETGLEFAPTALLGVYSLVRSDLEPRLGATPHAVKLLFRGEIHGELAIDTQEILDAKWYEPEEIFTMPLDKLRDLDIKRAVEDHVQGKGYPLEMLRHTVQR